MREKKTQVNSFCWLALMIMMKMMMMMMIMMAMTLKLLRNEKKDSVSKELKKMSTKLEKNKTYKLKLVFFFSF